MDAADRNELPGRRRDFRNGRNEVEGEFPLPSPSPLASASSHQSRGNSEGEGYNVEGKDNVDVWTGGGAKRGGRGKG